MPDDGLGNSQSVLSSVLGFVSREIQDFVVTAVTGAPSTSTTVPSVPSSKSLKHKRSASSKSLSELSRKSRETKPKRRRSSPHPHTTSPVNLASDDDAEEVRRPSRDSTKRSLASEPVFKKPSLPKDTRKTEMLPPSLPSTIDTRIVTPRHVTMPGSLFPRSPTPAEFRGGLGNLPPLPSRSVPSRSPSPDESVPRPGNRKRRRSSGRVRFAPHVVQHPPPAQAPSPEEANQTQTVEEERRRTTTTSAVAVTVAAVSAPPAQPSPLEVKVKEEDDDEIVILDRMPSPTRGRLVQASKPAAREPSRERRSPSPVVQPPVAGPSSHRNMLDLSMSDLTGKGKAKETYPEHERPAQDEAEVSRIEQLESEVQQLRAALANRSAEMSFSMPPPAPPAPPPPPPGYIAIPATRWENGPKHPSQRDIQQRKLNKSLLPTVPMESMEAFLGELKTFKLRRTGTGPIASPMTLRRAATSAVANEESSAISAGLQNLKAQLKRKRTSDAGADDNDQHDLRAAIRRRHEASSPNQEVHENASSETSSSATGASLSRSSGSRNEGAQWRDEEHSVSWAYPGPMRPSGYARFPASASTSTAASASQSQSQKPRTLFSSNLSAPPITFRQLPGFPASDVTTPSLCSDTEADPEGELEDESLGGPAGMHDPPTPHDDDEDEETVEDIQVSLPSQPFGRTRRSDLRLDDLQPVQARQAPPTRKRTPSPLPPPASSAPLKKSVHELPVHGTPNIFSARPPKSPLPGIKVGSKPKPPARAASAKRESVQPQGRPPQSLKLHSSALLRPPDLLADDDDELEGLAAPLVAAGPSSSAPHVPPQVEDEEDEDPLRLSAGKSQAPRQIQPQPQTRKAKRRVDDSLSLDEEMRRVAASERIAELDLDFELGNVTTGTPLDADSGVFVGVGLKSRRSGYTSGGGGGGIAVTVDSGLVAASPELEASTSSASSSFRIRSRIPVPKGYGVRNR